MIRSLAYGLAALSLSGAAVAVVSPRALAPAMAGLWEVSTRADGHGGQRVCIRNLKILMQWEHRRAACGQKLLADNPTGAVVDYQCGAAGFGHSRLTMLTPRTLKVETQGISANYPFQYTLHARRMGDCPAR